MNLRGGFTNLSDEEYEKLINYDFTVRNLRDEALEKCISIIDRFCREYLTEGQKQELLGMDRNDGIGFGIVLYLSLMYDPYIVEDEYREAVNKFPAIDAIPNIEESVYVDVWGFFE